MTTLSATVPPSIIQDRDEQRRDLAADLKALQPPTGGHATASVALQRPAILRRIADALAPGIPAGTDRLIAGAGTDSTLAAALSLHTGIAFALVDLPGQTVIGELHRSERTVLVSYETETSENKVLEVLASAGAQPAVALYVLGQEAGEQQTSLTRLTLFGFAEISTTTKESDND
ncbi:hypothetical protein ACIPYU_06115 [Paenarthrobacter nicotinovorans]|jgi:hypothetical protein|uniref:hypothetical protein n=1 Tax=Paenarthrobacter nicotinovorans TaxID=29320 RepID=UPI003821D448